jgi:predicted transcriptional regulator
MDKVIEIIASAFSLSEKEKLVFENLIVTGMQPASMLANQLEMPRNTVRGILDHLVKQGLVSRVRKKKTNYYVSAKKSEISNQLEQHRDEILSRVNEQISVIEQHGNILESPITDRRARISVYDGYKGLVRVYDDTLKSRTTIRSWASFDANQQALPRYFQSYYKRRAKRKIPIRAIHPDTKLARESTANNRAFLRKSILVPKQKFAIRPEVQVYDDKVSIVSWRDKMGIIIESQEIAEALSAIFDLSYYALKRYIKER